MQAGKELNELIATKVMDLVNIEGAWYQMIYKDGELYETIRFADGDNFNPSTNMADAWKVVEKLAQRYQLGIYPTSFGAWICQGYEPSTARIRVQADTAPLSICLAAIKAVGS